MNVFHVNCVDTAPFRLFQVMFAWSEQSNHTQLPAFRCNEQVLQCEKFSQFTCRMDMLNKIQTILNFLGQYKPVIAQ